MLFMPLLSRRCFIPNIAIRFAVFPGIYFCLNNSHLQIGDPLGFQMHLEFRCTVKFEAFVQAYEQLSAKKQKTIFTINFDVLGTGTWK